MHPMDHAARSDTADLSPETIPDPTPVTDDDLETWVPGPDEGTEGLA